MLYNEYRPKDFSQVKGQEDNVRSLSKDIASNSYANCYIFAGYRGTGKTTLARILARAMNCENPNEYGPCNECKNCRSILQKQTHDIIETDAASNNSINDIKELRSTTLYSPTMLNYKVYIIDEVHNLSTSAFNTLLKLVEEPPAHCKFILCTTELHKIPVTIRSRGSIYTFRAFPVDTIKQHLVNVLHESKKEYDEEAIELIAKNAEGGMRDALSILDRFMLFDKISASEVITSLGLMDETVALTLVEHIVKLETEEAFSICRQALTEGKSLHYLVDCIISSLTDVIVLLSSKGSAKLYNHREYVCRIKEISLNITLSKTYWLIEQFSDLKDRIRNSLDPFIDLQLMIVKSCNPDLFNGHGYAVMERIKILEDQVSALKSGTQPTDTTITNLISTETYPIDTPDIVATEEAEEDVGENPFECSAEAENNVEEDAAQHTGATPDITKEEPANKKTEDLEASFSNFLMS